MSNFYTPAPRRWRGVYCFTSVCPSVQDIFRRIYLSNCWMQKSDIWSQASYRYTILWIAFLDPSYSYFLFADLVGFYTHWTYMHIFRHIFLNNHWWQRSDIWSQASYRYPTSWEAFLDPSDSYFLFADLVGFSTHWKYMHIFLSNYWWSQPSYRYPISWEAFLNPSDSYFLFADFVDFYAYWTYMLIFLSNYWWQKSDIWSQASYRYPHIVGSIFEPIGFLLPVCRLLIFIHIEHICSFFVAFFSATIDDRNLIFGHKLHTGMPYCG
jgi:hypothetical protein